MMILDRTRQQATHLYLDMAAHQAAHRGPLGVVDMQRMLGLKSTGSVGMYVRLLEKWKLIRRIPGNMKTVVVLPIPGYPPVGYIEAKE